MKKCKIFLTLTLSLTSISFAIPKGPCNKKEVCCEEQKSGPFAFYYPKDMNLSCPQGFYVKGEFLLMQVKEEGLEYSMIQNKASVTNKNSFPLTGGDIQGYSTGHRSWDCTCGTRIGLGFYLNHNAWNIETNWTYIRINNDSGKNLSGGIMLPFWLPPNFSIGTSEIEGYKNISSSARLTGSINTLDLKLGKPYHVSRYVILNPYLGIRIARINQDYTSRNGGLFYVRGGNGVLNLIAENKNDFEGIGPRLGMDTEWHFCNGWHIFAKASSSLLYSHFDIYQELTYDKNTFYQLKHDFYTNSPNMEIILGLSWSHLFSKNKYMISIKAAYEMHQWWEQNRLRRFFDKDTDTGGMPYLDISTSSSNDEVARCDLTINGFSFAIQFDF
jgi:hypothetical protein